MNYGWLTNVADTAYNRMRDMRPEKNLQHNRELTARALQDAAAQADAEYQAALERDRLAAEEAASQQAAPVPAITAPVAATLEQNQAKWDDYNARRTAAEGALQERASAGEDVASEWNKTMGAFEAERASLAGSIGAAQPGSQEWMRENAQQPTGAVGGTSLSGGTSRSVSQSGAQKATRDAASEYLVDQFSRKPEDTRRDEMYLRNLEKARNQVLPNLWGTEGAGGIEGEMAGVAGRLTGKEATKLEIARMGAAAKIEASNKAAEASSARAAAANEANRIREMLGKKALEMRGEELSMKEQDEFGKDLRKSYDIAQAARDTIYQAAASGASFIRDSATNMMIPIQQAKWQADAEFYKVSQLYHAVSARRFGTREDFKNALALFQGANFNPQVDVAPVMQESPYPEAIRSGAAAIGINLEGDTEKRPGFTPTKPIAINTPIGNPQPFGQTSIRWPAVTVVSSQGDGSPAAAPAAPAPTAPAPAQKRTIAPPRKRKKELPALRKGETVVKDMGDYVWVGDSSGSRRKVFKK